MLQAEKDYCQSYNYKNENRTFTRTIGYGKSNANVNGIMATRKSKYSFFDVLSITRQLTYVLCTIRLFSLASRKFTKLQMDLKKTATWSGLWSICNFHLTKRCMSSHCVDCSLVFFLGKQNYFPFADAKKWSWVRRDARFPPPAPKHTTRHTAHFSSDFRRLRDQP